MIFQDEEQNNDFLREISFQTGKIDFQREKKFLRKKHIRRRNKLFLERIKKYWARKNRF